MHATAMATLSGSPETKPRAASMNAVAAGDDATADTEHRELVRMIDKAVKRGALHRNTGARKKARASRVRRGAAV